MQLSVVFILVTIWPSKYPTCTLFAPGIAAESKQFPVERYSFFCLKFKVGYPHLLLSIYQFQGRRDTRGKTERGNQSLLRETKYLKTLIRYYFLTTCV